MLDFELRMQEEQTASESNKQEDERKRLMSLTDGYVFRPLSVKRILLANFGLEIESRFGLEDEHMMTVLN